MIAWEMNKGAEAVEGQQGAFALYVYTPLCGTCAVARRMLEVAEASLPSSEVWTVNLNLMPDLADRFRIESVPCLLLHLPNGRWDKVYRFGSVIEVREHLMRLHPNREEQDHD